MNWYTRGARPERNVEAALIGFLLGLLEATQQKKARPVLYGAVRAFSSAAAMDKHRIVDRLEANQNYARVGDSAADLINKLLDARDSPSPQFPPPRRRLLPR
ncbi:MAG: hypothetical protein HS111_10225 [Kofleriaceae bacterium]|nr:hypothetical protein [Kofleriaceae bacterium]